MADCLVQIAQIDTEGVIQVSLKIRRTNDGSQPPCWSKTFSALSFAGEGEEWAGLSSLPAPEATSGPAETVASTAGSVPDAAAVSGICPCWA